MCWVRGWRSSQEWILMQGGNNEGFLSAPMAGIQTIGEIIQAEHVPWKRLIFSNKFDDVSMNMFPFRFLGTGGENEFLFLNCAMCKDCHLLLCCWMPRIFLVPREIWKDSLCDTVALFGTPCPPQELGRSHLELKNKRHWKTRPQHYRHINSSWKWVETIQATVCMQRFEKKCFVSIIHGFSSKQKSFMSIYRWQCLQQISGK